MVPTSSNDTDIDIDMDESSSGAVSDAVTNPLPPQKTKKFASATLWLVVFAVLVIGASIAGGYMLAMRQVNAGAQLSDAGGASIARDQSQANDTIISEPLESEEAEISPEPESSEQDSIAAKNTGIDVLVDVVGARVSLDGHYLGQAPLRVRNILPGSHQITVANADGSKVQERTVELYLGEAKVVSIVLGGSVEIAKDDKSDKTRGQESKKGRERRNTSDAEEKKQVEEQASSSTTDAEKVSLGTLMLGSKPPCAITIDGKATGKSTPQRAIQLPEGLHRVVLTNSEQGIRKSFKVRIKAGRTTRAIQDLRPKL